MPIVAADLIALGSLNRPEDDVTTSGGAIDTTHRPVFTQFAATDVVEALSDGADVRTLTVTGRLATGAIDTEAIVLTGAAPVAGVKSFERILKLEMSATDGARTVSVREGVSGPVRATIVPNEQDRSIMFISSASEIGATLRFEKFFWKNTHATLALTTATVDLTADPDTNFRFAVVVAKDDATSVANRKATPAGVTFFDDNNAQSVPSGSLLAGEAIGVWMELGLAASEAAAKSTFTTQLAGNTV